MARRRRKAKRKSTRTKYKRAFNVKTAAFSYLTLNATTQTLFNTNPQEFFLGGFLGSNFFGSGTGGSSARVTLKEVLAGFTLVGGQGMYSTYAPGGVDQRIWPQIQENIRMNLGNGIIQIVGLTAANKILPKLGVTRAFNRTVRSIGMGQLVKM